MNAKQLAIEVLEEAIEFTEKHLSALKEKLAKLKGDGGVTTQDGGPKQPLPDCPEGQIRNAQGICVDRIG